MVDVDLYDDGSFPTFGWLQGINARAVLAAVRGEGPVPASGIATRRQLRAMDCDPAARSRCLCRPEFAWLSATYVTAGAE
ncbi:hypothetical protein [Streptomyces sp. SAS_275]|uniref:hypothetical protein n=1 Tax=Streptomyces sp. SAS_275 TaxID=3412746 RepID=UPI00403C99F3